MKDKLIELDAQLKQLWEQLQPQRNKFLLPSGSQNFVTMLLDDQIFGIYLPVVQEVTRMAQLTKLVGAPPSIVGLLNLRGAIVPIIDLRVLLGLTQKPYKTNNKIILIEYENKQRGLIVDDFTDIITIQETELSELGGVIPRIEFVLAMARTQNMLITLLDHTRLLSVEQEQFLENVLSANKEVAS